MGIAELFKTLSNAAAGKSYIQFIVGAMTPLMFIGVVDDAQRAELLAALNQFGDALNDLLGASKRILVIATPIAGGVIAWFTAQSGTFKGLVSALTKKNDDRPPEEKVTIIAPPKVVEQVGASSSVIANNEAIVVAAPEVAQNNPSPNVISTDEVKVVPVDKTQGSVAIQPQ